MSFQLSTNAESEVIRHTAKFQPSIWGNQLAAYNPDDEVTSHVKQQQVEELKEEFKRELETFVDQPIQQLKFIDAIQRLGVGYHFEREIEETLLCIYENYDNCSNNNDDDDDNLYNVSLWFRLLRQQGYNVSSDIFNKFKNEKGNFKDSLIRSVHGVLSLYEAAHLRVEGEDVMEEALAFTTIHLKHLANSETNPLAAQIIHALKQPIHKGVPRLEARHYFPIYKECVSHNKTLLKFAKLDFNLLQNLHKKELSDITSWWKQLDFSTKPPFARDRMVECYFWALAVYFEPQYSLARTILTKVFTMTSVIDDIYDAYGTVEELELFTEAIESWDIQSSTKLPEYMKVYYQALLDLYEDIEKEMASGAQKPYRLLYAKQAMKKVAQVYFAEAKWCDQEYIPTMEEYMHIALLSSANFMLTATSFIGMGDVVTKDSFEWVLSDPKIVRASSVIGRLMDDITSHKFEQERGHVASAVECYMSQHGASEQQSCDELGKQVEDAWKEINQECLKPNEVPMPLLTRVLNLARSIHVIYKEGDGYTHVGEGTKQRITALLIDPVLI